MKHHWRKILVFLLILIFAVAAVVTAAADKIERNAKYKTIIVQELPADKTFPVTIPDGLYLYKPKIKKNEFSPLFIVKKGKLGDAYVIAKKIGKDKFNNDYAKGKTFPVSTDMEKVGNLTGVKFNFVDHCENSKDFISNIEGTGAYKGKPLQPDKYYNRNFYTFYGTDEYFQYPFPKFQTAAQLKQGIENKNVSLTEEDKAKAVAEVKKHFVPEVIEIANERQRIRKENRIVSGEKGSRLDFAWLVDLDGSGRKSIVGCYYLILTLKKMDAKTQRYDKDAGGSSYQILFVFRENGQIEKIAYGGVEPSFSLINAIDLNGDGIKEIIIEVARSEDEWSGKSIEVYSFTKAGWLRVFQSTRICGQIYD